MDNMTAAAPPALLTTQEVADALRVSSETIRRHVHDGTVRAVTIGRVIRIPASELDRLFDDVSATGRRP
jgi:excisionase family DNA binding protein